MKISCPYSALELQMAMISAANKFEAYEKEHGEASVTKQLAALPGMPAAKSRAEYNQIVADHHGISVDVLVNSPNYEKLQSEHTESIVGHTIRFLETTFGFDNKEAWAIVAHDEVAKTL